MNSPEIHIGERIRLTRMRAGLKQKDLAEKLGLTRAAISAIELGKNGAKSTTLTAIAQALNTTVQSIQEATPNSEAPFDVHAVGPLVDQDYVDLPFLDYKALANFGNDPGMQSMKSLAENSETLRVYLEPGEMPEKYEGAMVVEVWGDSMEPYLFTGDRMIVWQIPESRWGSLYNVDCVVAYGDTVTIKQIAENDLGEHDRLKLRAANPPTSYFVVPRREINTIWEVREFYQRPRYTPSARRR